MKKLFENLSVRGGRQRAGRSVWGAAIIASVCSLLPNYSAYAGLDGAEWVGSGEYRLAVDVDPGRPLGQNEPVGVAVDFKDVLGREGLSGRVDYHSIRVVAFDPQTGQDIVCEDLGHEIPYATTGDYPNTDAGQIWWRVKYPDNTHFHIYFDTLSEGAAFHDTWDRAPQVKGLIGVGDTFHYNNGQPGEADANPLHSQFAHVDWDGDGKRDLIGFAYRRYEYGMELEKELGNNVYFFKNIGTPSAPMFAPRQRVQGQDGDLSTNLLPQNMFAADWDNDGDVDFFGLGLGNQLVIWENTGERDQSDLSVLLPQRAIAKLDQKSDYRQRAAEESPVPGDYYPRSIRRVDWEGDGDFDLIVSYRLVSVLRRIPGKEAVIPYGAGVQIFDLFENISENQEDPYDVKYAKPVTIFDTRGLPIHANSVAKGGVAYTDWDGDGDFDLLFHDETSRPLEGGQLMFAENRGSREAPVFSMAIPILGVADSPFVIDWNNDGRFDLFAGGEFFENVNPQSGGTATRPVHRRTARGTRIPHAWSFPKFESRGLAQQIHPEILTYFTVSIDWDGDGNLDLLGGYHNGLRLFRNAGTTVRPEFEAPVPVLADGQPISMPNWLVTQTQTPSTWGPQGPSEAQYGWLCPTVGDWDGDGDQDLFVTGQNWQTQYFENISDGGEPVFARGREVRCDDRIDEFSWRSKVSIGDIDGDGVMEMVVTSDRDNTFYSYARTPKQDDPAVLQLKRAEPLLLDSGEPVKGWFGGQNNNGDNHSLLVDWDGDGDLDLLNGTLWAVWYYENVGTPTQAVFHAHGRFQAGGEDIHTFNHAGSFDAADWNADGRLDLVLGTECPSDQPRGGVLHLFDRSFIENTLTLVEVGELEKQHQ